MPLMVSVSGIRGVVSDGLTPSVVVEFAAAYATWVRQTFSNPVIILGRDSRVTGKMVSELVSSTLNWCGCSVIDLGMVPTPTVQVGVVHFKAQGGIIISASHNPAEWNALKLLNHTGEFMSPAEGDALLAIKNSGVFAYSGWNATGTFRKERNFHEFHINSLLNLPFIHYEAIRHARLTVVVDAVEGAGSEALPQLLETIGCQVIRMNCGATGLFPHTPEPLPQNLTTLMDRVRVEGADLGLATDPDADRLAATMETGEFFGEEYTITAATDYFLSKQPGPVVVNLSTTRAVADVASRYQQPCFYSPVGEINVVKLMQEKGAVIGGEGSGGVILPASHYGRDSLVAALLLVAYRAESGLPMSELKRRLPAYEMAKKKINLGTANPDRLIETIQKQLGSTPMDTRDGLKIDFPDRWVHLRKSNTEPILRIYTEAPTAADAEALANEFVTRLESLL